MSLLKVRIKRCERKIAKRKRGTTELGKYKYFMAVLVISILHTKP
jgi:hypothetical protein